MIDDKEFGTEHKDCQTDEENCAEPKVSNRAKYRADKRAAALRANLGRRKEQKRGQKEADAQETEL